jgi:hypothetical protein
VEEVIIQETKPEVVLSDPVVSEAVNEVVKSDPVVSNAVSETVLVNEAIIISDLEQSKAILINASKLIMDITASDDFNVSLDSSKQIADMIQKLLNL